MKVTEMTSRCLQWLGLGLAVLATTSTTHAQLTPIWTIHHGQAVPPSTARGEYYNNLGFFGVPIVQDTATIDFNWGSGSPAAGIPVDSFTARWTGTFVAPVSDTYTFYATVAGGVRLWVDDEPIINQWSERSESELVGVTSYLTAGSVYKLKMEFLETFGTASVRLQWSAYQLPKQLVRFQDFPDGSEAYFGSVLAGVGNGRFVVGAPDAEVVISNTPNTYVRDGGAAWFYDQAGQNLASLTGPLIPLRRLYGSALATFPDGRVLVGTANSAVGPNGTNTYIGSVFLHGPAGELLGE